MKILSIEDDAITAAAMLGLLTQQHYVTEMAPDAEWAWQLLQQFEYDLILLDITLPQLDGITLCRKIRSQGIRTPILIVSSHDQIQEKAIGLDAGADDYLVKPFHPDELFARIRALLRRGSSTAIDNCINWGNLYLNTSNAEARYCSSVLPLTPKEYAILELFLRHPKRVFSCGAILDHLWLNTDAPSEEAVRTHIKGLRQKLKAGGIQEEIVETVYGMGYRLKSLDPEAANSNSTTKANHRSKAHSQNNADPLLNPGLDYDPETAKAAIQEIWLRSAPHVKTQLETIQTGIAGLSCAHRSKDSTPIRSACVNLAHREAHTLAGSLGTFGFAEASRIAQQIEGLLQQFDRLNLEEVDRLQSLLNRLRKEVNL